MSLPFPEVYVVSGNLVSATASAANPLVVDDVLESNLLCQLAADKKLSSRFVDPGAWFDFYRTSLGKVFWKITNSNTVSYPVPPLIRSVTVMSILEHTFFKILDRDLRHQVEADIELLSELPAGEPASTLYNAKTHIEVSSGGLSRLDPVSSSVINLQISGIYGGTRVSVCSVYFKTSEPVGSDLFNQKFRVRDLSGNITVSTFEANLLEASYEGIRQQIKNKLGESTVRENILLVPESPVLVDTLPYAGARHFVETLDI